MFGNEESVDQAIKLKRLYEDYKNCLENDVFEGREEKENYEGSNDNMRESIRIMRLKEQNNPLYNYIKELKLALGPIDKHFGHNHAEGEEHEAYDENFAESAIKRENFVMYKVIQQIREDPSSQNVTIPDIIGNIRINQVYDESYLDMASYQVNLHEIQAVPLDNTSSAR